MLSERSDRLIYWRVLGPLVLAIGVLVAVSVGGFQALSAARAYVGGESLWSKARSVAVAQLRLRANGGERACPPLDQLLAVPLGDRAARLAMERSPPDEAAAREGFLRGGNSPDDIDALIDLYLVAGSTPLLRDSVDAWREGDALIEQLRVVGERVCAATAGDGRQVADADGLRDLDRIDARLIAAETRFSARLGDASRRAGGLLTSTILLFALLVTVAAAWYVLRSLGAQIAQRRALVDANTRWDLAAEAAGVGLFVWHPQDDALELDSRARQLYGLDAEGSGPVGRAELQARMHPDDRAEFERLQQAARAQGETLRARYRIVRENGAVRHVEAVGTLRNGGKAWEMPQMFGVLRDVTDEIAAGRLQVERDAAERSAQARSEFLSRLSHELRTPLNAVLGMAQLLDLDVEQPLSAAQRDRVRVILDSGWHLLHLVDDVLDITRIDSGQLALDSVATDPRAVLRASLALIEPERARLGIRIDDRWPAQAPAVLADPRRLQQVFVNLLSNACKYNRRGGSVTLTCGTTAGYVSLAFSDQGPGMTPEQAAELFQPFKRLAHTAEVPGVGLGLVVVKLLIDQMRGAIDVDSEPGQGARFTVRLRKA
ncbi:MAG TPA: ATP-binding protein [Burkholderiaceae bacterium]|nr:ATP-binding protein [Burkholderiaceae bacterium]